jgi:hypothetical protein
MPSRRVGIKAVQGGRFSRTQSLAFLPKMGVQRCDMRDINVNGNRETAAPLAPEKTAERPHRLTLAFAALSFVISLGSAGISIESLRVASSSLEVGQRAYLSASFDVPADLLKRYHEAKHVSSLVTDTVELSLQIKNLGNTPAYDVRPYLGFGVTGVKIVATDRSTFNLAPKTEAPFRFRVSGTEAEMRSFMIGPDKRTWLCWRLSFRDVFGRTREESDCWMQMPAYYTSKEWGD